MRCKRTVVYGRWRWQFFAVSWCFCLPANVCGLSSRAEARELAAGCFMFSKLGCVLGKLLLPWKLLPSWWRNRPGVSEAGHHRVGASWMIRNFRCAVTCWNMQTQLSVLHSCLRLLNFALGGQSCDFIVRFKAFSCFAHSLFSAWWKMASEKLKSFAITLLILYDERFEKFLLSVYNTTGGMRVRCEVEYLDTFTHIFKSRPKVSWCRLSAELIVTSDFRCFGRCLAWNASLYHLTGNTHFSITVLRLPRGVDQATIHFLALLKQQYISRRFLKGADSFKSQRNRLSANLLVARAQRQELVFYWRGLGR